MDLNDALARWATAQAAVFQQLAEDLEASSELDLGEEGVPEGLGSRQKLVYGILSQATDDGLPTSQIAFKMKYEVPNTYLTLQSLARSGLAELVAGSKPQRWRLSPKVRGSAGPYILAAQRVLAGEWATYGDLSIAVRGDDQGARAVGRAAATLPDFPKSPPHPQSGWGHPSGLARRRRRRSRSVSRATSGRRGPLRARGTRRPQQAGGMGRDQVPAARSRRSGSSRPGTVGSDLRRVGEPLEPQRVGLEDDRLAPDADHRSRQPLEGLLVARLDKGAYCIEVLGEEARASRVRDGLEGRPPRRQDGHLARDPVVRGHGLAAPRLPERLARVTPDRPRVCPGQVRRMP